MFAIGVRLYALISFADDQAVKDWQDCRETNLEAKGDAVKTEVLVVLGVVAAIGVAVSLVRGSRSAAVRADTAAGVFVFVKIPESLTPIERGEKYEDPLDAALKREQLGEITGGGSQLSEPDAKEKRTVEWVGLDVELVDLERGIPLLKQELLRLGAPAGTTLEFKRAGSQVIESISG